MKTQFITDQSGQKLAILTMEEYQQFMIDREELQAIKTIRDIENETDDIPEWHFDIIRQRMENIKKNPELLLDADQAIADIEKNL